VEGLGIERGSRDEVAALRCRDVKDGTLCSFALLSWFRDSGRWVWFHVHVVSVSARCPAVFSPSPRESLDLQGRACAWHNHTPLIMLQRGKNITHGTARETGNYLNNHAASSSCALTSDR
jgi:hypothetical protein